MPLKANSQRVPGKNFKQLGGKPLFQWMLDTLLGVAEIDLVVINTDARAILEEHGLVPDSRLVIVDRPEHLVGDEVSMNRIIEHDIGSFEADVYLMTHTTNPFLSASTIENALHRFLESPQCDSLFTVNAFQTRFYRSDGTPVNHDPENLIPTQDLEPWYEENSCLYIFSRESFAKTHARIGASPTMYVTAKIESVDIDDQDDWVLAEALAERAVGSS